jgi:ABC-type bacteriocin/lantibiotic exporter with double-glycine peptidase domain
MPAPTILEPIIQKTSSDCGIAAVAMLLGLPYAKVSRAALKRWKAPHHSGIYVKEVIALARALGARLSRAPAGADLTEETGLLFVEFRDNKDRHVCALFEGVVVNPANGRLYVPDVYLASSRTIVRSLWTFR